MASLQESVNEYKKQLEKGTIREAYKGLMDFMLELKTELKNKYPDYFVQGNMYYGYMDMTYFSFFPESFKRRSLRIAIVFLHEQCRFEAWLAGFNKQVQSKYWKLIKDRGWDKYPLVPTTKGVDSILEYVLVADPNFNDLDGLSGQIEKASLRFIADVNNFLSEHDKQA